MQPIQPTIRHALPRVVLHKLNHRQKNEWGHGSKIGLIHFKHIIDNNLEKYVLHPNLSFSRKLDQYYKNNNKYALFQPIHTPILSWNPLSRRSYHGNWKIQWIQLCPGITFLSISPKNSMMTARLKLSLAWLIIARWYWYCGHPTDSHTLPDIPANKALYEL